MNEIKEGSYLSPLQYFRIWKQSKRDRDRKIEERGREGMKQNVSYNKMFPLYGKCQDWNMLIKAIMNCPLEF